jgi:HlyD family secretion protein
MEMNRIFSLIVLGLILTSCSESDISDAYGQFEADEITISAEVAGTLQQFDVEEGNRLESGVQVGLIDTTQLHLKKKELQASVQSVGTNVDKLNAQMEIYQEQLKTAQKELNRFLNLKEKNAATQQ